MLDGAYSVRELNDEIAWVLRGTFADEVWVHGVIASIRRSNAGHVYFQLVDVTEGNAVTGAGAAATTPTAVIPVTLFDSAKQSVNASLRAAGGAVRMTDGTRIRLRARVDFYAPQGRVQLRMSAIDPAFTIATLQTERQRVLASLRTRGLIDRNGSLPFPPAITRVGLVTSHGSAAMADFMHELELSGLQWSIVFADARVQGIGAERSIGAGLLAVSEAGVDVIALVRGGGAQTDLAIFDSELLGQTISRLEVPVITGIGHEIDTSVADAVAHTSFKTPTACAAHIVRHTRQALDRAEHAWTAIEATAQRHLDQAGRAVVFDARRAASLANRVVDVEHQRFRHRVDRTRRESDRSLERATTTLSGMAAAVRRSAPRGLREADRQIADLAARVDHLDPQRLLSRGWSITTTAGGSVVRSPADVSVGDTVTTRVGGGSFDSTVASMTPTTDGGHP